MIAPHRTGAPARTLTVPAAYIGQSDALLTIDTSDGEAATMALVVNGEPVAVGDGFRVAEAGTSSWLDMPEREVVDTFGSFLAHAFESSEPDAREGWAILTEEASDWVDALSLYSADEYGTCDRCGEPVDYCQGGHGPTVEQSARMSCVIGGQMYVWHGGEYIEVGYIATERGAYEIDYGHAVGDFVAQNCINVWDHEGNAPTIARTLEAFESRCCDYAQEAGS